MDFWAPWCGPCRSVAPIVDDLATQYAGKIKVAKINVDESTEVATRYQITSIPTFILFKNGQVADRVLGALPRASSSSSSTATSEAFLPARFRGPRKGPFPFRTPFEPAGAGAV